MSEPPDELPDDAPPVLPFRSSRLIGAAAQGPQAGPSPTRPRKARVSRPGGGQVGRETTREVWMLAIMAVLAILGGIALHAHFAAKEALCNTFGGALAQQQSTGAAAHCGLNSFLSDMGDVVRWGGMIGLVFCAAALWAVRSQGNRSSEG